MKDVIRYIETEKKKYPMCMNLNVIAEIQEKYGTLEKWIDLIDDANSGIPRIKDLIVGLTIMINEAIDIENDENKTDEPFLNEKEVGRVISGIGLEELVKIILSLSVDSTKVDDAPKN